MARIRVLVVDDSVVVRKMLADVLSGDPAIEVVGTAASGAIALAKIAQSPPDLVTLDVEMPEMCGLEVLTRIRASHPTIPVVMFSSATTRAAATTLDALSRGAADYVMKPSGAGSREEAIAQVRAQLLPKVHAFGGAAVRASHREVVGLPARDAMTGPARPRSRVDILAIGSSTGGPNALAQLFAQLSGSLPTPIVIVQHMPPVFTRLLSERLSASTPLSFSEAKDGDVLVPGHAYIAPGDYHMRVVRERGVARIALDQGPPENSCRPAVDVLFRSLASVYGPHVLATVLTGMGQDGLRGCEQLHEAGSQIVVQDEASSVVWGMPGFVAKAGLADAVLPLDKVAEEISVRVAPRAVPAERRRSVNGG